MTTRIALIHAVTVAIEPVQEAFRQLWPETECCNILDDLLSVRPQMIGVTSMCYRHHRESGGPGSAVGGCSGLPLPRE